MGDADEWIFDSLMEYLRSPLWTTPVSSFIDRNCLVFDNEEENKFAYTDVHNEYKKLIDDLLGAFLQEMQIDNSYFLASCGSAMSRNYHKSLIEEFIAADDFLTFKAMMVKRNMELELDALRVLQGLQLKSEEKKAEPVDEDERMLQEAIRLSQLDLERESKEAADEIQRAIALSLEETSIQEAVRKQELASLNHAISISMALEAEKKDLAKSESNAKALEGRVSKAAGASVPAAKPIQEVIRPTVLNPLVRAPSVQATPAAKPESASAPAKPTEEELAKRAEYLKQQRERVIQIRESKRQEELQNYEKPQPANPVPAAAAAAANANPNAAVAGLDAQLLEARRALARRFKEELIGTKYAEDPSELRKKLDQEKQALAKGGN